MRTMRSDALAKSTPTSMSFGQNLSIEFANIADSSFLSWENYRQ
jgi:hypothetical protein